MLEIEHDKQEPYVRADPHVSRLVVLALPTMPVVLACIQQLLPLEERTADLDLCLVGLRLQGHIHRNAFCPVLLLSAFVTTKL